MSEFIAFSTSRFRAQGRGYIFGMIFHCYVCALIGMASRLLFYSTNYFIISTKDIQSYDDDLLQLWSPCR